MATKTQAKRNRQSVAEIGKRFSKAKLKRDMVSENTNVETTRKPKTNVEPKQHVDATRDVYQFKGEPKEVYSGILKRHTANAHGYSVLSKGQQVTVENFSGHKLLRVTAMDGRVGITDADNIKSLFS